MPGYVAAALVGVEAESQDEAWDRAANEADLPWEIAACVPQVTAHKAVEALVDATSQGTPLEVVRARRPLFGKFSIVAIPAMVGAYYADTSVIGAVTGAFAALASAAS